MRRCGVLLRKDLLPACVMRKPGVANAKERTREMLLCLAVALPWVSLLLLGSVWLWQHGYVWLWSLAAAILGLLAWPLSSAVRRGAKREARAALDELAQPSR